MSAVPEQPDTRRSRAAERQRTCRARRRAGLRVFLVEADLADLADLLTERGALAAWDAHDPEAVQRALGEFIRWACRLAD